MAGDTVITVIGNLTGDPELRFSKNGAAVANFTIASTPRNFDRQSGEWKEGETLFLRASVWKEQAENVAESLRKGSRVIAQGRLKSRQYETKEGERRTSTELEIEEIGPSLRFASASVNRNQRAGNGGGNYGGGNGYSNGGGYRNSNGQSVDDMQRNAQNQNRNQPAPAADPWAAQSNGNYDWGSAPQGNDEPPF